jgi:hypothetical protein
MPISLESNEIKEVLKKRIIKEGRKDPELGFKTWAALSESVLWNCKEKTAV